MDELFTLVRKSLADMGFMLFMEARKDLYFYQQVNYFYEFNPSTEREEVVGVFLVVRLYKNDEFINFWVDKLPGNVSWQHNMGNGFIHKSLRTTEDWAFAESVIKAALPG